MERLAREETDFAEDEIEEKMRKWWRTVLRSVFLLKAVLDLHLLTRNRRLDWMDVAWNTAQLMNRAHPAT